jgi:tetratricopeptide (TPR) repeat protein/TolB-like protein
MIGKTISHYKILEKLGEGGMGVVYRAEDTRLDRHVALKFLSPHALGTEEEKARFVHEAKAAAALNHPNIGTIHEIDEADGQTFIAMALIEGESLESKIGRGPLKLDEAIDLALQVAEGLAAAHERGVVHRDIKPGNVMTTAKGRAKVMDFGLARSPGQTRLTKTGTTTGTIAYMSPEQSRGEDVDHRTDIWSFGVMLYEMVTGQRPFRGDYEQAVVHSIINDQPEPMTGLRTGVPMELERITGKAMAKRPGDRYQHADDVLVDLKALGKAVDTDSATSATIVRPLSRPASLRAGHKRTAAVMAAVAIAALATTFGVMKLRGPGGEPGVRRVVVAAFENRTGDDSLDPLGPMIADWFAQGLSQIGEYEVVSGGRQRGRVTGIGTQALDEMARLRSLAKEAGAEMIVSGAYYAEGDDLRFQASVTSAANGSIIYAPPAVTGSRRTPTEALETLRQRTMGALVTDFDPTHLSQPPIYEAYQEYATALRFFGSDYPECIRHLERAVAIDSTFLSPRLYMAIAYGNLNEWAKADSIITEVARNRERLAQLEQHLLGWYTAYIQGNHEEALRCIRQAGRLDPTSTLATYVSALMALYLNRPQETVYTLEPFMSLEPSTAAVMWSWGASVVGYAHHTMGNYSRELELMRRYQEFFPNLSTLRAGEVQALAALGRVQEVRDIVDQSLGTPSDYGSPYYVIEAAAAELRAHGHPSASLEMAELALDWCRSQPQEDMESEELRACLATALCYAERWDEARAFFEELAAESPEDIDYTGPLGTLAARRGDREEALRISAELEHLDRPYMFGMNMYWCGCISALLGEKERATGFLREAFARGCRHGGHVDLHCDINLESLRDYPPFRELARPKG